MAAVPRSRRLPKRSTLFEWVITGSVVVILMVVAVNRIWTLRVFAERIAFTNTLGTLRDAVGMEVALYMAKGDMARLASWSDRNPMRLLAIKPRNYVGVVNSEKSPRIKAGSWYFDDADHMLVYKPVETQGLETRLRPRRIRWQLHVFYRGTGTDKRVADLRLVATPDYVWKKGVY